MSDANAALAIWLERLRDPDPDVRAESIKELELLGDTAALPGLADVFATDPDPALRGLAQMAGKAIYYGAIRQALEPSGASEQERRQAAEILAKAQARKSRKKRRK
jgi:HEAT repeat protein